MNEKKEILVALFNSVDSSILKQEYHKFHLETVKNYITHFGSLKTQDQEKVYDVLYEYLSLIKEGLPMEKRDSLRLFRKYISPLIDVYLRQSDFTTYLGLSTLLFWFVVIQLIVFLFIRTIIGAVVITILFSMYYTFFINKKKIGKVNGYNY